MKTATLLADTNETTWWELDRAKDHPRRLRHPVLGVAINCGEDKTRVAVIGYDRFVADSFAEFVDRHIENRDQLSGTLR